jgi:hypothetical protein
MNYSVKPQRGIISVINPITPRLQAPEGRNIGNKVLKSILRPSGAWRRKAVD